MLNKTLVISASALFVAFGVIVASAEARYCGRGECLPIDGESLVVEYQADR